MKPGFIEKVPCLKSYLPKSCLKKRKYEFDNVIPRCRFAMRRGQTIENILNDLNFYCLLNMEFLHEPNTPDRRYLKQRLTKLRYEGCPLIVPKKRTK